jgi:hypothetical protein
MAAQIVRMLFFAEAELQQAVAAHLFMQPVGRSFAHSETVFCGHDRPHQTVPMVMQVMIGAVAIMIPRPNTKQIFDHHN